MVTEGWLTKRVKYEQALQRELESLREKLNKYEGEDE